MLDGRVTKTVGEIELTSTGISSRVLKVHCLKTDSVTGSEVALALVSKAPLAVSMVPIKLSQARAQQLIDLLQKAMAG